MTELQPDVNKTMSAFLICMLNIAEQETARHGGRCYGHVQRPVVFTEVFVLTCKPNKHPVCPAEKTSFMNSLTTTTTYH